MSEERKAEVAIAHKAAIRDQNPFSYRDGKAWQKELKVRAVAARAQIDLTKELNLARDMVIEIAKKCTGAELAQFKFAAILQEIKDYLASGSELPGQRELMIRLDEIVELIGVDTKLTETASGKIIPMSDKSRISVMNQTLATVAKLGLSQFTINKSDMIPMQAFQEWMDKLSPITRRYIADDQVWSKYVRDVIELGDPEPVQL